MALGSLSEISEMVSTAIVKEYERTLMTSIIRLYDLSAVLVIQCAERLAKESQEQGPSGHVASTLLLIHLKLTPLSLCRSQV